MNLRLQGKVAVITGAGNGIGLETALTFAREGARVAVAEFDPIAGEAAALRIREDGGDAAFFPVDVSDWDSVQALAAAVAERYGRIDVLVNNAGMNIRTPALDVTDEEWDRIVGTNLTSAFMLSQIVGGHMKERGTGRIVNIASVAGHTALRTGVVYGSTKAALIQMTKILALEWGKYGIRVNAVGPWYFPTPPTEKLLANGSFRKDVESRTPLGRVGRLEELVGPVAFLASDAASYVTGQTLFVDGGMTIYGF